MSRVLSVLLTHQPPEAVARMLRWWQRWVAESDLLLLYGGREEEMERIAHPHKIFIADPRLRTKDHQRELQSYTAIYRAAGAWLRERDHAAVFFSEFDQLPVRPDFLECYARRLAEERADVLAYRLWQVDGTNYPHYLFHAQEPKFHAFWEQMSRRENRAVILSMLGTGSFWTREAFLAVSEWPEPFAMYHELFIPTLAHHLGFRVRDLSEQNRWVQHLGRFDRRLAEAAENGAWTVHPVKRKWLKD